MFSNRNAMKAGAIGIAWGILVALADTGLAQGDAEDGFNPFKIWGMDIVLEPTALRTLTDSPRSVVRATVKESGVLHEPVGIHLKGSKGSFRPVDDKPSLTLDFAAFDPSRRFHSIRKLHLNNCVEDAGYLNELLGAELFRRAGVPVPKGSFAWVRLNGRTLGLYVLKEGFTEDFLFRYFPQPLGTLYEPAAGPDEFDALEPKGGSGSVAHAKLAALRNAVRESNLKRRREALNEVVEVESFLTFAALEVISGHRDGYCLARNNYRLYHNAATQRFAFLPHGMDQLFGNPALPWRPEMVGQVAIAMLEVPQWRDQYRARVLELTERSLDPKQWEPWMDQVLKSLLRELPRKLASEVKQESTALKQRIRDRRSELLRQLRLPKVEAVRMAIGETHPLRDWKAVDIPESGQLDLLPAADGTPSLRIVAGPRTSASWRTRTMIHEPGRYRFEGRVKVGAVAALPFGQHHGACLRVRGEDPDVSARVAGDSAWTLLSTTVEVRRPRQELEWICELRASSGIAWFQFDSLRLIREKEGH